MRKALVVLTCGAFLTLAAEVADGPYALRAVAVGLVFSLLATVGYAWIDRQPARRRLLLAIGYIGVQHLLGLLLFAAGGVGVGAVLFQVVLVSQSVLLLPLWGAAIVTASAPLVHLGMPMVEGLRTMLGTLVAVVFTAVVTELLRREQQARAELGEAHERLRGSAAQAEELATTRERNRLARDIHDGLGHHLTVVQMQVQAARAVLSSDPARADAVLAKAQEQATEALAEVRRSVAALRDRRARPPLAKALTALAEDTSAAGVPTELEVTGTARPLPTETEESLFRAAQEALTNVRKHAAAGRARLVLDYRDGGTVRLEVDDDGRGMSGSGAGFGLVGLRERAARLGGSVDVESAPGRGTRVRVAVPG